MAVPDTDTFSLQDVVNEINPTTDDLVDCINDANSGLYDPTYYTAPATSLLEFRNYGAVTVPLVVANNGSFFLENNYYPTIEMFGTVSDDGGSAVTDRGFYYSGSLPITSSSIKQSVGTGGTGSFSETVAVQMSSSTAYIYYRAYAVNAAGEVLSSETKTITIPPISLPEISALPGSFIAGSPAKVRCNGELIGTGGQFPSMGVYWSLNQSKVTSNSSKEVNVSGSPSFSIDISVIQTGIQQTLYYRTFAENDAGEVLSSQTISVIIPV